MDGTTIAWANRNALHILFIRAQNLFIFYFHNSNLSLSLLSLGHLLCDTFRLSVLLALDLFLSVLRSFLVLLIPVASAAETERQRD
ncbi:hypothetical protein OPV22_005893 [Ensete ventricosum]|uniref:Uncharacterized protein n=1 Tax=Ensete ventricosum TaxID=4639 RepID=A0AAV8RK61_ENSVE|nr:hypothetical protein OPV22_005893 [Ensete ventricosum]